MKLIKNITKRVLSVALAAAIMTANVTGVPLATLADETDTEILTDGGDDGVTDDVADGETSGAGTTDGEDGEDSGTAGGNTAGDDADDGTAGGNTAGDNMDGGTDGELAEENPLVDIGLFALQVSQTAMIDYVNGAGQAQTPVSAELITADTAELYTGLPAGWYYVEGDVAITETVLLGGDVNLILTDDCNLTIDTSGDGIFTDISNTSSLTIYGQSGDNGKLNITAGGMGIEVLNGNIEINGGDVKITSTSQCIRTRYEGSEILPGRGCDVIINGGKVDVRNISRDDAISAARNVYINGGKELIITADAMVGINASGSIEITGGEDITLNTASGGI